MFLGCHTLRFLSLEGFTKGASKLTQDTEHPCSGAGLEALKTAQDGSGQLRTAQEVGVSGMCKAGGPG